MRSASRGVSASLTSGPSGGGEAPGHAVPRNAQLQALACWAFRCGAAVSGVVFPLREIAGDAELIAHCTQQCVECLDCRRYLIGLEPADRRLAGAGSAREALLAEA